MTISVNYASLLDVAKFAAQKAGEGIMEIYESGDYQHFCKEDDSPVTTADYKANDIVISILAELDFDIPVISEEKSNKGLKIRRLCSRKLLLYCIHEQLNRICS
jgi:3'(2'), 5'-bisphosphate nucleotidase